MKLLKWLDDKLERNICIVLLTGMTLLIFIQVIMRYIFNNSLSWSEELARYFFIWLIYFGISYGAKIRKHLKIEAFLFFFPKKLRVYVEILGDTLFLAFSVFVIIYASELVEIQIAMKQISPALGIPMAVIYTAPMVGFLLTAIRQIQTIIYRFRHRRDKEKAGDDVG